MKKSFKELTFEKFINSMLDIAGRYMTHRENENLDKLSIEEKKIIKESYINAKTIREKVYLYRHNLEDVPKCKECGKRLEFHGSYTTFCSIRCVRNNKDVQEKMKATTLKKYGVENPSQCSEIKQKKINTHLKNYGTVNNFCNDKIKEKAHNTIKERYGVNYPLESKDIHKKVRQSNKERYGVNYPLENKEIRQKIKETNLSRYGVDNLIKDKKYNDHLHNIIREKYNGCGFGSKEINNKIINTFKERYGVEKIMENPFIVEKIFQIRKERKHLNSSKLEEYFYNEANKLFKEIHRQYLCKEYPWKCDFYIKDIDTYIEINGMWTHGYHPYDENNEEDKNKVKLWVKKYDNGKHPFYMRAIEGWTMVDVKKRNTAKENNLNFIELWNKKDVDDYLNKFKECK